MILRTPRSTLTDTLFPYTTLFRSVKLIALFHNKRIKRNCVSVPAQSAAKLIRNLPGAALDVFASAARDSHAAEGIWNDRRFGHGAAARPVRSTRAPAGGRAARDHRPGAGGPTRGQDRSRRRRISARTRNHAEPYTRTATPKQPGRTPRNNNPI